MIGLAFGALSTLGTIGQFAGNLMGASARRAQVQEQIRATEMQKAQTVGLAAARSGASGVEGSSASTMDYLSGLGAEFDRVIGLQKKSAATGYALDILGAGMGLLGGASNVAGGLGKLNNWWQTPPGAGR